MSNERYWLKSGRSTNFNNCVELLASLDRVRDSKDPQGPMLEVDVAAFVRAVRAGRFDR